MKESLAQFVCVSTWCRCHVGPCTARVGTLVFNLGSPEAICAIQRQKTSDFFHRKYEATVVRKITPYLKETWSRAGRRRRALITELAKMHTAGLDELQRSTAQVEECKC